MTCALCSGLFLCVCVCVCVQVSRKLRASGATREMLQATGLRARVGGESEKIEGLPVVASHSAVPLTAVCDQTGAPGKIQPADRGSRWRHALQCIRPPLHPAQGGYPLQHRQEARCGWIYSPSTNTGWQTGWVWDTRNPAWACCPQNERLQDHPTVAVGGWVPASLHHPLCSILRCVVSLSLPSMKALSPSAAA